MNKKAIEIHLFYGLGSEKTRMSEIDMVFASVPTKLVRR
jgi:hypothetical protein